MIAYASRTGTAENIALMRAHGWRMLVSAANDLRHEGMPYALDNGAWSYHQKGLAFDERRYERAVDLLAERADWTVIPDVVGNRDATLKLIEKWLPMMPLARAPRVLLAVQDGMTPSDVAPFIAKHGRRVGIFLGGSDDYKLGPMMRTWGDWCDETGVHYHVARVNSASRIRQCASSGALSFDGTSVTRFARKNIARLDAARREPIVLGDPLFDEDVEVIDPDCGDPWCDYDADARFVHDEMDTYRDDEPVTMMAGALRRLLVLRGERREGVRHGA